MREEIKPNDAANDTTDESLENQGDEHGGDLRVALRQERERRQAQDKELTELKAKLDSDDYKKMEALATEYESLLPYLPKILEKAAVADRTAGGGNGNLSQEDQELTQFALAMGLTDEEGSPDLGKAKAAVDYLDRRAGTNTRRMVEPISRQAAEANAVQIRQRAYGIRDEEGNLYAKREFIDKVFDKIDPIALNNPENATAALILARGLGGPGGEEELGEPLFTQGGGRRPAKKDPELSDVGKQIAKIRGKSVEDWQKLHDDPKETGDWDLE